MSEKPARSAASAKAAPDPQFKWRWLLFWLATAAYFVTFYRWTAERWVGLKVHLSWLLVPDVPLQEWVGGDWNRFDLSDRIPVLTVAAAMLLLAFLAGVLVLNRLGAASGLSRLELAVLGIATGLGLFSNFILVVGLAGGLQNRWLFATAAVVVLVSAAVFRRDFAAFWQITSPERRSTERNWLIPFATSLSAPFAVLIMLGGMLPPWHFDVREYHAQVPKEWYQQGSVAFLPHNVYGNMPLGAEIHSVAAMNAGWQDEAWWWGTIAGKSLLASFAVLTALSIYSFGRRHFSAASGAVAAFLFLSTPWVAFVSMSGLIEGASAFYAMATLQAILLWNPSDSKTATGRLAVAGFLAGSAVACKYPAVLFVAAPATVFVVARMDWRQAISRRWLSVFVIGVAVGCGLWFAKNAALTHNPTYPLLYDLFDGKTRTAAKHAQWTDAHRAPPGSFSSRGLRDSAVKLLISSEHTSALLVPFALLAICCSPRRREVALLIGLLAFTVIAWWLLTHRLERFLLPHLPFAAILGGLGATYCGQPNWHRGVAVILTCGLLCNLTYISSRSVADNRFLVSLEKLRRISLADLGEHNPHIAPAHLFLNASVAPGYRAIFCGEAQVFNLRVPVRYNTCFDDCVLEQLLRDKTAEERLAAFREQRISHVLVDWRELDRYRSPGNYGYSSYVTRSRIRDELVVRQQLLIPIPLQIDSENTEVFEVRGWRSWPAVASAK